MNHTGRNALLGQRLGPWIGAAFSRFAAVVANAALQFWLAAEMGPMRYGAYLFALTASLTLTGLVIRGQDTLALRWTARYKQLGQSKFSSELLGFGGRRALLGGVLGAVSMVGISLFTAAAGATQINSYLLYAALLPPLMCASRFNEAALRGAGHPVRGSLSTWGVPTATMALLLLGKWLNVCEVSSAAPLIVHAVVLTCFTMVSQAGVRREYGGVVSLRRESPPSSEAMKWKREINSLQFLTGAATLHLYGVLLLVGWLLGPEQTSYLGVALRVSSLLFLGVEAVSLVSNPRFSASHSADNLQSLQLHASRAVKASFACATTIALAVILLHGPALELLGKGFSSAGPALIILTLSAWACTALGSSDMLLNMTGNPGVSLKATLLSVAIGLSCCLLLSPAWGVVGAAAAHAISLLFKHAMLAMEVNRRLTVKTGVFAALFLGPRNARNNKRINQDLERGVVKSSQRPATTIPTASHAPLGQHTFGSRQERQASSPGS